MLRWGAVEGAGQERRILNEEAGVGEKIGVGGS